MWFLLTSLKIKPSVVSVSGNTRTATSVFPAITPKLTVYATREVRRVGSSVPVRIGCKKSRKSATLIGVGTVNTAPNQRIPNGLP